MEAIIKFLEVLPEVIQLLTAVVGKVVALLWEIGTLYAVYCFLFKNNKQ